MKKVEVMWSKFTCLVVIEIRAMHLPETERGRLRYTSGLDRLLLLVTGPIDQLQHLAMSDV